MTDAIEHKIANALTVQELIDALQDCNADAKVVFACDYGDIGHTMQALIVSDATQMYDDEEQVVESAYSQSGLAIEECDNEDDYEGGPGLPFEVVVLR